MVDPFISIVIVNYNAGQYLRDCIDSIVRVLTIPYEIIIVDNRSDDGSLEFVNEFNARSAIRVVNPTGNIGFGAGCNLGARESRGQWLHFLNPDTVINKAMDLAYRRLALADDRLNISVTKLADSEGRVVKSGFVIPTLGNYCIAALNSHWGGRWYKGASVIMTRRTFDSIGGWSTYTLAYAEDVDLFFRVKRQKIPVTELDVTVIHAGEGCTQNFWNTFERRVRVERAARDFYKENRIFWQYYPVSLLQMLRSLLLLRNDALLHGRAILQVAATVGSPAVPKSSLSGKMNCAVHPGGSQSVPCPKVSLCAPVIAPLTFIDQDLRTLAEAFNIHEAKCATLLQIAQSCLTAARSGATFCWFGSLRFLPAVLTAKLFSKPVAIVAGGYDVANVAAVHYGNMARWHSRHLGRFLFRLADVVLAVSRSAATQAEREAKVNKEKIEILYNGVDLALFSEVDRTAQRQQKVLVVANLVDNAYQIKNIDYVLKVASHLPEIPFELVGKADAQSSRMLRNSACPNFTILGPKTQKELVALYRSSLVYFQPSLHESFGCAVAEAMICGCIPVVSDCFALPEVVGKSGILVDPTDVESAVQAIRSIVEGRFVPLEDGSQRVRNMFSFEARSHALKSAILGLTTGARHA